MGVFSVEEACFQWKRRVFATCMIIHVKRTARDFFSLGSVNGCQNRSGSIQNGSVKTVPERFCSVNKLLVQISERPVKLIVLHNREHDR